MSFQIGAPADPRYLAFKDGAKKVNDDWGDQLRWRWAPGHGNWYTYPNTHWIINEVGLPDTSPPWGLDFTSDSNLNNDFYLPDLFRKIDEVYAKSRARWPDTTAGGRGGLIWTWRNGGAWRVAMPLHQKSAPPLPPKVEISDLCKRRIDDVRGYWKAGYITAVEAQNLIKKIVDECT